MKIEQETKQGEMKIVKNDNVFKEDYDEANDLE